MERVSFQCPAAPLIGLPRLIRVGKDGGYQQPNLHCLTMEARISEKLLFVRTLLPHRSSFRFPSSQLLGEAFASVRRLNKLSAVIVSSEEECERDLLQMRFDWQVILIPGASRVATAGSLVGSLAVTTRRTWSRRDIPRRLCMAGFGTRYNRAAP